MIYGQMISRVLLLLGAMVLVSGCARGPTQMGPAGLWSDQNAVVGVAVVLAPDPAAYKKGSQGLLDMAINAATAGSMESGLKKIDLASLQAVQTRLVRELSARGVKTRVVMEPIDPKSFAEVERDRAAARQYVSRDYSRLKAQLGIDRLLLVQVTEIGTTRNYFGFVPTSAPEGYARLSGTAVEVTSGKLLWNVTGERVVSVKGEWDQPPQYGNLNAAVGEAFAGAAADLVGDLSF